MAKKKTDRRPNISNEALERARRELYGLEAPPVETSPASARPNKKPATYVVSSIKQTMTRDELAAEYGYVLRDLRSMGALAGVLFIGMVVVALLLERV